MVRAWDGGSAVRVHGSRVSKGGGADYNLARCAHLHAGAEVREGRAHREELPTLSAGGGWVDHERQRGAFLRYAFPQLLQVAVAAPAGGESARD